jgi:hypothetical protein
MAKVPKLWFQRKLLLREIVKDKLPPPIYLRPKTVLPGNPVYDFFRQQGIQEWMKDLLNTPAMEEYINARKIIECIQSSNFTPLTCSQFLSTLNFAYWLRTKNEKIF